jgi:hypothetical protein
MAVPFLEFTATPNRRFEFQERSQLFVGVHDERRGYLLMQW